MRYFGGHIRGVLTDKLISKYVKSGFYEFRGEYLKEKKRRQQEKEPFRLVYDCDRQDFILV